jgi:NH3-dependent NAD+ synthetase
MKRLEFRASRKCHRRFGRPGFNARFDCGRANNGSLGLPRENILGFTMPGFATSSGTLSNAHALMKALGISAKSSI